MKSLQKKLCLITIVDSSIYIIGNLENILLYSNSKQFVVKSIIYT